MGMSLLKREKLELILEGVASMKELPQILIVFDPYFEKTAVAEAFRKRDVLYRGVSGDHRSDRSERTQRCGPPVPFARTVRHHRCRQSKGYPGQARGIRPGKGFRRSFHCVIKNTGLSR